jgi:hypothetical protein
VHHQIDMVSADPRSLPYADASFDAVVSGLALHHIEGFESRVHAMRELSRVLRVDGRVVLIDRHHTRHYVDALRACNFVDVKRSRRVWRLLPPARYVTGTKAVSARRADAESVATPEPTLQAQTNGEAEQPMLALGPVPFIEPVLTEAAARDAAEEFLDEVLRPEHPELELTITEVLEFPTSWVVGWNTRAWAETQSISQALAGNGPIIVSKRSGIARLGLSALPVEDQLDPAPGETPAEPVVGPVAEVGAEQLELSATVTGERDGAGHEAQDGPSM